MVKENCVLPSSQRDDKEFECRVFKMKLAELMKDLKDRHIFGRVIGGTYTIEFQKRGLPHAHILIFLHRDDKFPKAANVDKIISAEIPDPDENPLLYALVKDHMIHGPCGKDFPTCPCMVASKCSRNFPKRCIESTTVDDDGYPVYKRREKGFTVVKSGRKLGNEWVVPYNAQLLLKYRAHINVEWCNQARSIKYLFKYINKGPDRATMQSSYRRRNEENPDQIDEIQRFHDCRYISACEAVWRIFGFEIHYRTPPVERLRFHLPDEQSVVFNDEDPIDSVIDNPTIGMTKFLAWMDCNKSSEEAQQLLYSQFPTKFVWKQEERAWHPRKSGFALGRMHNVSPNCGELSYMRTLLNFVKGPKSYEDLRWFDDTLHPTFRAACYARGLLGDDKEYIDAIEEASRWGSGSYLRNLFVTLLLSAAIAMPSKAWEKTWKHLSDDILYQQRNALQNQALRLTEDELKNYALLDIEACLQRNDSSLRRFEDMPFPESSTPHPVNTLVSDELSYDRVSVGEEHVHLLSSMTNEQMVIYNEIMDAIRNNRGASSGIAATLLPGGITAHSRLSIPLNVVENSTCSRIKPGSDLAELLIRTKLIIWDEAPMTHRYAFEAVDRSLRDVMRFSNDGDINQPFGGKVVVFGGDFRQILPVIPKGSRSEIVNASLCSSNLWSACKVLKLTKNMRLRGGDSCSELAQIKEFSEWILKVGDGEAGDPNDGEVELELPNDILIQRHCGDPIASIVDAIYPSLENQLSNPVSSERAILAPTHEIVDLVNDYVLSRIDATRENLLDSVRLVKMRVILGSVICTPQNFLTLLSARGFQIMN
ncbi:uncharacterized protein LOC141599974 [Silene latifolia]|uniref:uncharacterized protein LOC141599974 n=1 Tax=Silene latifolia TaxID=37657 RepID=UPI003D77ADE2